MKSHAILGLIVLLSGIYIGCTTDNTQSLSGVIKPTFDSQYILSDSLISGVLGPGDYLVARDITVPEDSTLTINPGTGLYFDNLGEDLNANGALDEGEDANGDGELNVGLFSLIVKGQLVALGTKNDNILFSSVSGFIDQGDYGQWHSLIFDTKLRDAAGDTSVLAYCKVICGASTDTTAAHYPADNWDLYLAGGVYIYECSPILRNCIIAQNGYHGIYILGEEADPYIVNNTIYNNDGDGIRPEDASMVFPPTRIEYNVSKENNGLQFGTLLRELGFGINDTVNYNLDSCDLYHNITLEPLFKDEDGFIRWDSLYSCSAVIDAGKLGVDPNDPDPTPNIGSISYTYPYGSFELRRRLTNDPITGGTYHVTCDAFVEASRTDFSITDAEIIFDGVYKFEVYGKFTTDNTDYLPTPEINKANKWNGLIFKPSTQAGSYVRNNCTFVNASSPFASEPYGGAITVQGCAPDITDNTFINSEYAAISCLNVAEPTVLRNHINGFGTVGINCYNNSHPEILQNVIHGGLGNGIWCSNFSSPHIAGNLIYNNDVVGIRLENEADPRIEYNTLTDNRYGGIKCYTVSDPDYIRNNVIALNGDLPYSCGISAEGSSLSDPLTQITYNNVYVDTFVVVNSDTVRYEFITIYPTPETVTNVIDDPAFYTSVNEPFHLGNTQLLTASSDTTEVGYYGYQE